MTIPELSILLRRIEAVYQPRCVVLSCALGARAIVRHLGIPRWKLPLVARHMHRLAARDARAIGLFPGVPAMLADLSGQPRVRVAILSSNRAETVRRVLGPENAACVADYACGGAVFGEARRLRALLRRGHRPRRRALHRRRDPRPGGRARGGLPVRAVAWSYTDPRALAALDPEHLFRDPAEVAPAVRRWRSP